MNPPEIKQDSDKYVTRLERDCPHCHTNVVSVYDKETLRLVLRNLVTTECPSCSHKF